MYGSGQSPSTGSCRVHVLNSIVCRNTSASQYRAHSLALLDAMASARLLGVGGGGDILSMISMDFNARSALLLATCCFGVAISLGILKSGNVEDTSSLGSASGTL